MIFLFARILPEELATIGAADAGVAIGVATIAA